MLIDTHAHIYMLENPEMSIIEARDNGVKEIIIPTASEDDFETARKNLFPYLYCAELASDSDVLTVMPVVAFDIYADDNVRKIMSKKDIRLQDMVQ